MANAWRVAGVLFLLLVHLGAAHLRLPWRRQKKAAPHHTAEAQPVHLLHKANKKGHKVHQAHQKHAAHRSAQLLSTGLHNESADMFEACWDKETKSWRSTPACSRDKEAQQHFLCHHWMVGNCIAKDHPRCAEIDQMCQKELHMNRGLVALRTVSRRPINFIHIPKNAGTAIEEAGHASSILWGKHSMNGLQYMEGKKICVKWHVPPQYLEDEAMLTRYRNSDNFCVVRHPFDRAVSEYLYLLGVPWGSNFSNYLYEEPECTPAGLNHFLRREIEEMEASPFRLDCHMLPQSKYVWGDDGHQWCNTVLRMDNLSKSFNSLMEEDDVQARMTPSIVNGAGRCGQTLGTNSLWASTKDLLYEAYKDDFVNLGFKRY